MNVTRDYYFISGQRINIDFIVLPTHKDGILYPLWTNFYQRMNWNTNISPPSNLLLLTLINHGTYVYRRCPPFFLELDPCNSWLEWLVLETPNTSQLIKVLRIKDEANPNNILNNTSICNHIDYIEFVSQLETLSPPHAPRVQLNCCPL